MKVEKWDGKLNTPPLFLFRTFVVRNFYTTLSRSGDFLVNKALQDEQRLPFYHLRSVERLSTDLLQCFMITQRRTILRERTPPFFSLFFGLSGIEPEPQWFSGHRLNHWTNRPDPMTVLMAVLICWCVDELMIVSKMRWSNMTQSSRTWVWLKKWRKWSNIKVVLQFFLLFWLFRRNGCHFKILKNIHKRPIFFSLAIFYNLWESWRLLLFNNNLWILQLSEIIKHNHSEDYHIDVTTMGGDWECGELTWWQWL